jgi:hypothetical protein
MVAVNNIQSAIHLLPQPEDEDQREENRTEIHKNGCM